LNLYIIKLLTFILLILPPLLLLTLHSLYYFVGIARKRRKGHLRVISDKNNVTSLSKNHRLSIVIPVKNEPIELIVSALKHLSTLKHELGDNYEVLIISDDPPEEAARIAGIVNEKAKKYHLNVKFVNRDEGPPGRAAALNYGVLKASGDLILILDVDSRPTEGYISKLIECIDSGYDACVGRWSGYWLKSTKLARSIAASMKFIVDTIYRGRAILELFTFPLGSGTLFKRESLLRVGLWDPTVIQDDMYIGSKFLSMGLKVGYVDDAEVKVLVPSTYGALRIQQSRWAFGATNVLRRTFKHIIKAPYPILSKLEAILFLAQYLPQAILGLSLFIIPVLAITLNDDIVFLNVWTSGLIFALIGLYGSSYYHSLRHSNVFKLLGASKLKLVRLMGTSGALTLTLSPLILYYFSKGLISKTMSYKITPKGSRENIFTSAFKIERLLTVILMIFLILMTIRGHALFTILWTVICIAAFIYVQTNAEKHVEL